MKITGKDLEGAEAVKFGTSPATSYTVNTKGTKIIAYSPPEEVGSVDISVITPPGVTVGGGTFTYGAPSITNVKPASGPIAGGTKVTITGSALAGPSSVMFGSTPATKYSVNTKGTKITVYSPAESAGTVNITVTTPGGMSATSLADRFTY